MAYYITDKHISELALTQEGVNLIIDKLRSYGHQDISVSWRYESEKGETSFETSALIQIPVGSHGDFSNIVGISKDQIYINPISVKIAKLGHIEETSGTLELKTFIESEMVSIIRDNKINKVLNG